MTNPIFSVTQDGKPFTDYQWDEKTKTFSTNADCLILDFQGIGGVTFNTGVGCTFNTGSDCTFNTGGLCTFNTGCICTFNTGHKCVFMTGFGCTFTCEDTCVGIRRDVPGVTVMPEGKTIKYNGSGVSGYTYVWSAKKKKVTLELTDEQLEKIKGIIGT